MSDLKRSWIALTIALINFGVLVALMIAKYSFDADIPDMALIPINIIAFIIIVYDVRNMYRINRPRL